MSENNTPPAPAPAPAASGIPTPPQWFYAAALLLGVPLSGGAGSMFGASQAASDLQKLEEKVDKLDDKLTELHLAIVAVHGKDVNKP